MKLLTHSVRPFVIAGGIIYIYDFLLSRPRGCLVPPCHIGATPTGTGGDKSPNFWVGGPAMYWSLSTFWSNAASYHCVAWKHTCATQWVSSNSITWLFCVCTGTDYTALTLMSLHESLLRSLRIVQRHLDAFELHCILSLSLQHPTTGHSVRLNYIWYYVCMRYYNIYLEHDACNRRTSIKLNRFCVFGKKMCELAANGKDREWGGEGWQHACAVQTNMVPLNFFSIVAPMPCHAPS